MSNNSGYILSGQFRQSAPSKASYGTRFDDEIEGRDGRNDTIYGNRGNDLIKGLGGKDNLYGNAGDDTLDGGAGNDVLDGGSGDDILIGGAGNDQLYGGSGDDIFDSGSGSDRAYGSSGRDTFVHRIGENTGSSDFYDGSSGVDTLVLELTGAEWGNADVQADIARFVAQAARRPSFWACLSDDFKFKAFDLRLESIENLRVIVDGVELDPRDETAVARDDSYAIGQGGAVSGDVLANDSVPDLVGSISLIEAPSAGDFVFNADGTFTYSAASAFDWLAAGQIATVSFRYSVVDADGDSGAATATITITGTNDGIVVGAADLSGAVTEDGVSLTDTGVIAFADVDLSDVHSVSATFASSTHSSQLGALMAQIADAATGDGAGEVAWSFAVDNAAVQFLGAGDTVTETYTVTLTDNEGSTVTEDVTVTITGTNDAIVVGAADLAGAVTEDAAAMLTDTGVIAFSDVDLSDVHSVSAAFASSTHSSQLGTLTVQITDAATGDGAGEVAWSFAVDNAAVQFLGAGDTVTETYTVTLTDNEGSTVTEDVTVTLTGTNDAPIFYLGSATGTMTEYLDGSSLEGTADRTYFDDVRQGGSFNLADFDLSDVFTAHAVSLDQANLGYVTVSSVSASPATGYFGPNWQNLGVGWVYHVDDAALDFLAEGQVREERFELTVSDDHGGAAVRELVVTLVGRNDGVVIGGGDSAGAVTEDVAVSLTDIGVIAFADADLSDVHSVSAAFASSTHASQLGTLTAQIADAATGDGAGEVAWSFAVDNAAVQFLGEGETVTETYTVTLTDNEGSTVNRDVAVTITGTNDAPVIAGAAGESVAENAAGALVATFDVADVDTASGLTFRVLDGAAVDPRFVVVAGSGTVPGHAGAYEIRLAAGESFDFEAENADGDPTLIRTIEVNDGQTANNLATAGFTITVTDVPEPPTATDDLSATNEDAVLTLTSAQLTGNDVNPLGAQPLTIAGVSNAINGTVSLAGGVVTLTPAADFSGVASFDYTLDNGAGTDTGTVTIEVAPVADAPRIRAPGDPVPFIAITNYQGGYTSIFGQDANGSFSGMPELFGQAAVSYDGLATGDIDGDGDDDILFTGANSLTVLFNEGSGTFVSSAQAMGIGSGNGAALGDLDADGDLDLVVSDFSGYTILENNGTGSFAIRSTGLLSTSTDVGIGDLNSDGNLDIIISSFGQNIVLKNNGNWELSSEFVESDGNNTYNVTLADVDADGDLDIIQSNISNAPSRLLINDGAGAFLPSTQSFDGLTSLSAAAGDLNGDGTVDIVFAGFGGPNQAYFGDGSGNFVLGSTLANQNSYAVTLHDVDRDGDLDAIFANAVPQTPSQIWLNDGSGQFTAGDLLPTGGFGVDVVVANSIPVLSTSEDASIPIPVALSLTDTDGSETLTALTLSGVPAGATISDGTNSVVSAGVAISVLGWNLAALSFQGAPDANGAYDLTLTATVTDTATLSTGAASDVATFSRGFTVTVTPVNDGVVVGAADSVGAVTEGAVATLTDTGVIAFTDADLSDVHSVSAAFASSTNASQLGALTAQITDAATGDGVGEVAWNFAVDDAAVKFLGAGDTVTETYSVTLTDNVDSTVTEDVTVTITGTNDTPVVAPIANAALTEPTHTEDLSATIDVSFTDADLSDTGHSATITGVAASGATAGLELTETELQALVSIAGVNRNAGSDSGSATLAFHASGAAFDYLNAGETLTLTYTMAIDDGKTGGATETSFDVTITGTDDTSDPVVIDTVVADLQTTAGANGIGGSFGGNATSLSDPPVNGTNGTDGANGNNAVAAFETSSFGGNSGNDVISVVASSQGALGGQAGAGGGGSNAVQAITSSEGNFNSTNPYHVTRTYGEGGDGGNGGKGGDGGAATSRLNEILVDTGRGDDVITLAASATGGDGRNGSGGGFGGYAGKSGDDYISTFNSSGHWYNGVYVNTSYYSYEIYTYEGGNHGDGGDAGDGGHGGEALASVRNSAVIAGAGDDQISVTANAQAGRGASGGNGGNSRGSAPAYPASVSGEGGNGGDGGRALAEIVGNHLTGGNGNDVVRMTATTQAGFAGNGGYSQATEYHEHFAETAFGQTRIYYYLGDASDGGNGGAGGSSTLTIDENEAIGGAGSDQLKVEIAAVSRTGASGGVSSAYASGSSYYYSFYSGTAANNGTAGASGHVDIAVTNNLLDGGNDDDTLSVVISVAGTLGSYVFEDNIFEGGEGVDHLDLSALAIAPAVIDLEAGTADLGGGSNVVGGIERVTGTSRDDTLLGSAEDETFSGGNGNDRLDGRGGHDTLTGGLGSDIFDLPSAEESWDTVTDFVSGQDHFELSASEFGGGLVAGNAPTIVSTADPLAFAYSSSDGYFLLDITGADAGSLYWDETGGSAADAIKVAELTNQAAVQAADFLVVT